MFAVGIRALVDQLIDTDAACCDRDELAELVTSSQKVRGWLDATDAWIALRARELADQGVCEAPSAMLAGGGRRAARDSEAAARRAGVCEQMPSVHDALAEGDVSAGHVDALVRLADNLDDAGRFQLKELEPTLVGTAKAKSVEEFARECRDLERILTGDDGTTRLERQKQARNVKRWVDRQTGMCHTQLELDPETDAKVSAALSEAIATERAKPDDGRTWEQIQADALVNLITGAQSLDPRSPELTVLIDLETLLYGLHERSVCETGDGNPLPPDTIRRLGCDANIVPIVLGGNGVVLDEGRERRLATREQRRALRAMYRTCGFPGWQVSFEHCRIHHVKWWDHHGETNLDNLIPLCQLHHHLVHEGGWTLSLQLDRTITLHRPDGTLHYHGSTVDRVNSREGAEPAPPEPADDPPMRPGECEIPLHLRRKAAEARAALAEALAPITTRHTKLATVGVGAEDTGHGRPPPRAP